MVIIPICPSKYAAVYQSFFQVIFCVQYKGLWRSNICFLNKKNLLSKIRKCLEKKWVKFAFSSPPLVFFASKFAFALANSKRLVFPSSTCKPTNLLNQHYCHVCWVRPYFSLRSLFDINWYFSYINNPYEVIALIFFQKRQYVNFMSYLLISFSPKIAL